MTRTNRNEIGKLEKTNKWDHWQNKKKRKPEKSEHTDSYDEGATTCANIEKQSPYYFLIMLLNHRDHNSEPWYTSYKQNTEPQSNNLLYRRFSHYFPSPNHLALYFSLLCIADSLSAKALYY